MIAVLGGLGAAFLWAAATVSSSRSSRLIGPASVVAWVMAVGLVILIPGLVATGVPPGLDAETIGWLLVIGIGNVVGLLLVYSGLRIGKVGLVAPITSTEGSIAATIAVLLGERIPPGAGLTLVAIAVGVILAGAAPTTSPLDEPTNEPPAIHPERRAALFAIGAAVLFGVSLYAAGRVSTSVPLPWILLSARAMGALVLGVPLALAGRLRLSRRAVPLVTLSGVCEVAGSGSFVLGAQHGIAITAVLSSQFAAIASIAAFILFRERLFRVQVAGVATILAGVAVLSYLQA
jgi:drug/metabolite transporter (DMT)-like permease